MPHFLNIVVALTPLSVLQLWFVSKQGYALAESFYPENSLFESIYCYSSQYDCHNVE